jgi:O-antigen ligase
MRPADSTERYPAARWAEGLRRSALGLASALIIGRACWPGEVEDEVASGQGMGFVVLMLFAGLLGVFSMLLDRRLTVRLAWADAAVVGLFALLAASAGHAADRRLAINLAWQLVAVGLAFLLVRWLTRGVREQAALATLLVGTATALSAYGLYQVSVLHPEIEQEYRKNPVAARQAAGVGDDESARRQFEDRLLGSKEPTATFALTNSLAGFLVGPGLMVIAALVGLRRPGFPRTSRVSLFLLVATLATILACFLLTKSRSGYIGFALGLVTLIFALGARLPRRAWLGPGLGLCVLLAALAAIGVATRQLDRWVLIDAGKSLRFRSEYWIGTLRMLRDQSPWWWLDTAGWWGVGLGNFAGPYLRYKLPEASEGIRDPHNLLLEVWATAGLVALVVLVCAIVLGLRGLFGRPTRTAEDPGEATAPADPARWLVVWAGLGGWILAMLIRPDLSPFADSANPFEGDWMRWAVLLGGGIFGAAAFGRVAPAPLMLRAGLAAGFVALLVNLLAAGGIAFPPIALMLWIGLALGLNLRNDQGCGVLRSWDGWWPAFAAGALWAALAGVFAGTMLPYFRAQEKIREAGRAAAQARRVYREALREQPASAGPLDRARGAFEKAEPLYQAAAQRYRAATQIDPDARQPWLLWAGLDLEGWRARGAVTDPSDLIWHRVDSELRQAATPPRDPGNLQVHVTRARLADQLLTITDWPEVERERLMKDRADAAELACHAHPTSATLHDRLAHALAALGHWAPAVAAGRRAIELDGITPHADKKLPDADRDQLVHDLEAWQRAASAPRPESNAGSRP